MRRMQLVLSLAVAASCCGYAQAGWPEFKAHIHAFMSRSKLDFERNHAWPEPFRYADRMAVRDHWTPYVNRGWQIENTLTSYHFDDDTLALNAAGQSKLYWIMTNAPPERRMIFVVQDRDGRVTESRVDLVQQAVTQLTPSGSLPAVIRTTLEPTGIVHTGDYQDRLYKSVRENAIVPSMQASGGGASTGSN